MPAVSIERPEERVCPGTEIVGTQEEIELNPSKSMVVLQLAYA
jgi:hypothetical protein